MIEVKLINKNFILNEADFQSLNSKGYGQKKDGIYYLNIYEVLYLIEKNKIKVLDFNNYNLFNFNFLKNKISNKISFNKLIKIYNVSIINYFVYKDLKLKGYVVLSGFKYGYTFRIYLKSSNKLEHSLWLVEPVNGSEKIIFKDILGKNRVAHSANKKLLFAIVDIEMDVTYIETSWKKV